jgi:Glycosyltransferase 61
MRWGDALRGDLWRLVRVRLARTVLRTLLGQVVAEIPLRYMTDLTFFLSLPDVSRHVIECAPWTSAFVEEYDFPTNYPLEFRRSHAFDQRFIYRVSDVIAAPRSGVILITERGRMMGESYGDLLRSIGWGDVRRDLLAHPFMPPWPGPVVLSPPTGYYHWLLEILPRVLAARDIEPNVKAVVPSDCPRYITDALALLGIELLETRRRSVRLDDVLVPAALQDAGFIPSVDVDRLCKTVLPKLSDLHDGQIPPELVYVSRAKDALRRLGNERSVEQLVSDLGFDVVYLQDMTWTEQIQQMSKAQVVVAPHGAGLANMIWSNTLLSVIEIFPVDVRNDCYANLAVKRGAEYSFLMSEHDPQSSGMVDLQELERLILSILQMREAREREPQTS